MPGFLPGKESTSIQFQLGFGELDTEAVRGLTGNTIGKYPGCYMLEPLLHCKAGTIGP